MIVLATFLFGYVGGYEFNPQTFARRHFGFYEIPLIRWQVTPLYRVDYNGEVEQLVQAQKYVTPEPQAPEQWHLIYFRRSTHVPPPTDVQILARYLDAADSDSNNYWHEWSIKHPDLAPILWPEVARLGRLELYVLVPPLFELAKGAADDPKAFAADLSKLQSQQLRGTAERWQRRIDELGEGNEKATLQKRIAELLTAASELAPDDAELKALQEKAAALVPPEAPKQSPPKETPTAPTADKK